VKESGREQTSAGERARALPRIADCHNDLLVEVGYFDAEPHPFRDRWLDQLRHGGVVLQICPVSVEVDRLPEWGLRTSLRQIAACHRAVADDAQDLALIRDQRDLDRALAEGRLGLMLSMEGAEPLGYDPSLLDAFWILGVRMLALTWNRRNPFADGLGEPTDGGLSQLGRRLVDRAVDLGMILDLAHASQRTFFEVLERAADSPVVVSHAGCRTVYDTPRNLSDDQLRALAERGGVLGVMAIPLSVDLAAPSLERVLDHIDHAVSVMGVDHVGIGADFMAQIVESGAEPAVQATSLMPDGMSFAEKIPGLRGPADYPALVEAMRARGYVGTDLASILSDNLLRVIGEALARGGSLVPRPHADGPVAGTP
jgi:membrane dipeptidase